MMLGVHSIRRVEGYPAAEQTLVRLERASAALTPAPFLVVGTGIAMVVISGAWAFSQVWVYLSLGLFVIALSLGAMIEDPAEKRIIRAREQGGSAPDALDRFVRFGFVEILVMVGIVFLMVFKPM